MSGTVYSQYVLEELIYLQTSCSFMVLIFTLLLNLYVLLGDFVKDEGEVGTPNFPIRL